MEGHPLCQAPSGRTIYTCCVRRDQQLSQLPAPLLTWNPPLCAQSRPSQAEERSRLCLRDVRDTLPGHRVLPVVQRACRRAQLARLPSPVPPLRSSASAPPRLPGRSMEGHPLCQAPSRSTIYTCCLRRDQQLSQLPALLLTWNPRSLPVRPIEDPHRQRSTAASACATSGTLYQVTGFCPWCSVHVRRAVGVACHPRSPRCAHQRPPHLGCRDGPWKATRFARHPLAGSSTHAVCGATSSCGQLPAPLLTWNPPLCAQSRPSQAEERSRLCLRDVRDTLPGHRVLSAAGTAAGFRPPAALPVRSTKTLTGGGAQPRLPAPCQGHPTTSQGSVSGAACCM